MLNDIKHWVLMLWLMMRPAHTHTHSLACQCEHFAVQTTLHWHASSIHRFICNLHVQYKRAIIMQILKFFSHR